MITSLIAAIGFGYLIYSPSIEQFRKRKPKHDGSVAKRVGGYVEFIKIKP